MNVIPLDIKKEKLKEELSKPIEEQNRDKIRRLEDSIKRHKLIMKKRRIAIHKKERKWKR